MKYTNIRVLVARSVRAVDDGQCDDVRPCDTIKEAKAFARYALDRKSAYQSSNEMTEPMNYARVMADETGYADNVCVADFFAKGYSEPVEVES